MYIIVIIFIFSKNDELSLKKLIVFYLFEFLLIRLFLVGGSLMATLK